MKSPIVIATLIAAIAAIVCVVVAMWPTYVCMYRDQALVVRCLHGYPHC